MDVEIVKNTADQILRKIARKSAAAADLEAKANAEIEAIRVKYGEAAERRNEVKALEDELKKLMKSHEEVLFGGEEEAVLTCGVLTHTQSERMTVPKAALEVMKAHGWLEGIRVREEVDRETVKSWPAERLAVLGVRKTTAHHYGYELTVGDGS